MTEPGSEGVIDAPGVQVDPVSSRSPRRRFWRKEYAFTALVMALYIWFLGWTTSANSGFSNWGELDYFQLMVRGWMKGHVYLDKEPAPELLALADPYDPAQNGPYKLGDASYYKGHYYIYFGPAPAFVLMAPYMLFTGQPMYMGVAVFIFSSIAFLTACGLWLAIRRRYFPGSSALMAPLGVLGIGFGTHLLALAQRPMIWELPIAGGVAFTLLAVAAGYWAIHGRRPSLAMAAAGLSLGLAVGSRPTCLLAAPLLLPPLWLAWREKQGDRAWWKMAFAAAVPLGLCGLALMAYNHARFENPFEFGQHYQLSGAYEGKLTHFSIRFLWHDFAVYFLQPLKWTWEFPFTLAWGDETNLPEGHFGTEEVCGIAVTLPFVWFLLGLPLAWRARESTNARGWTLTFACIAGYAVPVAGLLLSFFGTCARYQTDFAVVLGILSGCGMLAVERSVQRVRFGRVAVAGTAVVLVSITVVIGALLSADYHGRSMRRTAPERWQRIDQFTNTKLSEAAIALGLLEGPRVLKVRLQPRPTGTVETFWRPADARVDERIVIEHIGDHLIRFGFARGANQPKWGRPLTWESNHTHTVSVQLPSLYGSTDRWISGLRRTQEFRERSAVAVWFSGGRALGLTTVPPPRDIVPGGALGADLSGEAKGMSTRLFRDDEIAPVPFVHRDIPRTAVFRMRVIVPEHLHEEGEPLFAVGLHYRSSILIVREAPGGVKFVYDNYATSVTESEVVKPSPEGNTLELELPSFRAKMWGEESTGDVILRLDGREIMHTKQVCFGFGAGEEAIGSNPFGTSCGPTFRGWLLDLEWIGAGR